MFFIHLTQSTRNQFASIWLQAARFFRRSRPSGRELLHLDNSKVFVWLRFDLQLLTPATHWRSLRQQCSNSKLESSAFRARYSGRISSFCTNRPTAVDRNSSTTRSESIHLKTSRNGGCIGFRRVPLNQIKLGITVIFGGNNSFNLFHDKATHIPPHRTPPSKNVPPCDSSHCQGRTKRRKTKRRKTKRRKTRRNQLVPARHNTLCLPPNSHLLNGGRLNGGKLNCGNPSGASESTLRLPPNRHLLNGGKCEVEYKHGKLMDDYSAEKQTLKRGIRCTRKIRRARRVRIGLVF